MAIDALANPLGSQVQVLIQHQRVNAIEAQFGRYPPLTTALADSLGFQHDGDAQSFMRRVLTGIEHEPK